jgi:hypothetical protein
MLYPIDDWDTQPGDVPQDSFTSVVLEARLLPNAELLEFRDGAGPEYDCSIQEVTLFADLELRVEGGETLGVAERVALHVAPDDNGTGGSFFVEPNAAMAEILGESVDALPDPVQIVANFAFDPNDPNRPRLMMSGLDDTGSTRPLAEAVMEEHTALDE